MCVGVLRPGILYEHLRYCRISQLSKPVHQEMFCNESSDALSTSRSCASLALVSGSSATLDWEEELGKGVGRTWEFPCLFSMSPPGKINKVKGLYETFAHTDHRTGIAAVNPARVRVPKRSSQAGWSRGGTLFSHVKG